MLGHRHPQLALGEEAYNTACGRGIRAREQGVPDAQIDWP
jgi:hypothetical protein